MSTTATARRRGTNPRRRNLAGEELIIFGNPSRTVFDQSIKKWVATTYHPKHGNLFATGETKAGAREALKNRVREAETAGTHRNPGSAQAIAAAHQKKVQAWLAKMPKPIRDVIQSRGNPDELGEAVRLFEVFHGRQPSEVLEEQRSALQRRTYTALGDLSYILVEGAKGTVKLEFDGDGVKLAMSPNGRQLYLIGGDQDLDRGLGDFTDDESKDLFDLGTALEVEYVARKTHSNYEPIAWYHKFGEEKDGSELPRLFYDRLKREIFFAGGEYFVDDTNEISPGIEN